MTRDMNVNVDDFQTFLVDATIFENGGKSYSGILGDF